MVLGFGLALVRLTTAHTASTISSSGRPPVPTLQKGPETRTYMQTVPGHGEGCCNWDSFQNWAPCLPGSHSLSQSGLLVSPSLGG